MRVSDMGKNLKFINDPVEIEALMVALQQQSGGISFHRCGTCKSFYVLATDGYYHHVYGFRSAEPGAMEEAHVHMEPDRRR